MKDNQNSKSRKQISQQYKDKVKKKPCIEEIGPVNYTYSLLKKKNQNFILSNERLLVLKGLQSIAYAREIPDKTLLPFYEESNIPKFKVEVPLSQIRNITTQSQLLVIEFAPETKQPKWQFVCQSKYLAEDWKKIIFETINALKLHNSNYPIQIKLTESQQKLQQNSPGNSANGQSHIPGQEYNLLSNGQSLSNISSVQANSPYQSKLQIIPEQHQDNQTENPGYRTSGHPLGIVEQNSKQNPPEILNLNLKPESAEQNNTLNLKQLYMKTKKQQQKMKDSLIEQDNLLKNSNISVKSNKNQPKILDCNWDYQFVKGESEFIIVERFKLYVDSLVLTIIDELALEEKKRRYKPMQESLAHLKYQIGGVTIHLALLQLNQVSSFQDRSTIVSGFKIKQAQQEFKNANYILQITRNKGRFRVPLMCVSEYKGFTAMAKANIHTSSDFSNLTNFLQQDINQLERDTKISRTIFEDEDNLKVVASDQKFLEKLSRSQNKYKKYDICFLTDIQHFLPQDFYGFNRQGSQVHKLRSEILHDDQYEELLFNGGNLNAVLSRVKVPNETRDAINLLTQISKTIPERVNLLIHEIQNLDQVITNSHEFSKLLHLSGLNIRYIGLLLDHAKQNWLKSIILSEVVARSAKYFLRYDLQDSTINLGASNIEQAKEYQINQVIGWLNRILGIGPESDSLWRQIFRQAQTYFKCTINRQSINIGFLIQALQHHGRFCLQNITLNEPFFKANNILSKYNFSHFIQSCKSYDLSFTEHYSLINSKIQNLTFESFEQLKSILNLDKKESLDSHYRLNGMYQNIILYLVNWLPPSQAPYLYKLEPQSLPSQYLYQVQLTAIKWELKAGRIVQAQKIRDLVVDHIGKWLGECHPILADLYDIFARYYLGFRQEEKRAVSYCKSSLKNQEMLLGGQHIKLADGYYHLADIYLHYGKKADALQYYRRASQILIQNRSTQTQAFIEITLKVGQLYLANNAVSEALNSAKQAFSLSQELNNRSLYLASAQLIGRCYEITEKWGQYIKFISQLSLTLASYRQNESDLSKMIKVILLPVLHNIATKSRQSCKSILNILQQFQERSGIRQLAYSYLKIKIEDKLFPNIFFDYLDNIEPILKEVQSSGLITRWKGFESIGRGRVGRALQFLCFLQSVTAFLDDNFVEGIFAEQQ